VFVSGEVFSVDDLLQKFSFSPYQQGSHFVRSGVEGLGNELQRRGAARHSQWGAHGIALVSSSATNIF
jgi:hypothetical protein